MWLKNGNLAGKGMKWADAMEWVKTLNCGDFRDWRLPKREELEPFVKLGGDYPSKWFNANGFNNVQSFYYWSSSTNGVIADNAWVVYMLYGDVRNYGKGNDSCVWPVRSGRS